MKNKKVLAII